MGNNVLMNTLTCSNCGKTLAKVKMDNGEVEIKCSKCGTTNSVKAKKEEIKVPSVKERQ